MRKAKAQRADSGNPVNLTALTVTFMALCHTLFMFEATVPHPASGDGPMTIFNPHSWNRNFRETQECTPTFSRDQEMAQPMFGSSLFCLRGPLPPTIQTQAWHLFVWLSNPSTGGHKLLKTEDVECCILLKFRTANMRALLNGGRAGGLQHLSPLSAPTPIDWLSPWGRRCPVLWCDGWTWGS